MGGSLPPAHPAPCFPGLLTEQRWPEPLWPVSSAPSAHSSPLLASLFSFPGEPGGCRPSLRCTSLSLPHPGCSSTLQVAVAIFAVPGPGHPLSRPVNCLASVSCPRGWHAPPTRAGYSAHLEKPDTAGGLLPPSGSASNSPSCHCFHPQRCPQPPAAGAWIAEPGRPSPSCLPTWGASSRPQCLPEACCMVRPPAGPQVVRGRQLCSGAKAAAPQAEKTGRALG